MTGYQKLKKENEILWGELEGWLYEVASSSTEDKEEQKEKVEREIAYLQKRIKEATK